MAAKKDNEEHSREFLERTELQRKDLEIMEAKHKMKMEELAYDRETNRLFHEWSLERGRIQRAEKRKMYSEQRSWGGRG